MDWQAKKEKCSMIAMGVKGFAVILGGNWNNTSNSGSRTSNWNNQPWNANNNIGARFAAVATKMCRFVPLFSRGIGRVLQQGASLYIQLRQTQGRVVAMAGSSSSKPAVTF
jgi:hypothetical protein